jgi:hypothetical protein
MSRRAYSIGSNVTAMTARIHSATLLATLALAACTASPAPDQFFTPQDLSELVTNRTLAVAGEPGGSLLYLSGNGTGWLARDVRPGRPPMPGGMSMVFAWRLDGASRICYWATPRIGAMPDFAPSSFECLQILRSPDVPGALTGIIEQDHAPPRTRSLEVYAYSLFPPSVIDQYLTQVRVFYGGHIPAWTVPVPLPG